MVLFIFLLATFLCVTEGHYLKSTVYSPACKANEVCEYEYTIEMGYQNQPVIIKVILEIACESSGIYEAANATRYCMVVSDVEENLPSSIADETLANNLAKQQLSRWFCFIQTADGKVVAVLHPQDEEDQVINFKKGIAAAFQANFRGTSEEIETDLQSMHRSHYSYSSEYGIMHRSIKSKDVFEYSSNIGAQDVLFYEEDDIEYRNSTLVKSNGTLFFSIDKRIIDRSLKTDEDTEPLSIMTTAKGSFSMELKRCKIVSGGDGERRKKDVWQDLDSNSAVEETLMATFNQEKMEIKELQHLRQNLKTPRQVVAALRDTNSIIKLKQVMVLERKYPPQEDSMIDIVLHYLTKITVDEFVSQRVNIYFLLSYEGSIEAENALIGQLTAPNISSKERNAIILAISSLQTPSNHLIQMLEDLINESDKTTNLILAYGSLVANAGPNQEERMVTFLTDKISMGTPESTLLIHILHALGNTESPLALQYIVPYVNSSNEDVRLTTVIALRFFTGQPSVQQILLHILHKKVSEPLVEAVINALHDGYDYKKLFTIDFELIQLLTTITTKLKNKYLQTQLNHFLFSVSATSTTGRERRDTAAWNSPSQTFDIIAPLSERMADIDNYPDHYGFLWTKTLGKDTGENQIYIQATGGLFAGANTANCNFKIMGKAIVRGHVLSQDGEIINILGRAANENGTVNGKFYVKFVGQVLLDINPSLPYTWPLPEIKLTLFNLSYTFFVYSIPVMLSFEVNANLGGNIEISSRLGENGTTIVVAALTPSVTLTLEASTEIIEPTTEVFSVGVLLAATIPYKITMETEVDICSLTDEAICVDVAHGWSEINIKLAGTYRLFSSDRKIVDSLSYTWHISAEEKWPLYDSCAVTSAGTMKSFHPLLVILLMLAGTGTTLLQRVASVQ